MMDDIITVTDEVDSTIYFNFKSEISSKSWEALYGFGKHAGYIF